MINFPLDPALTRPLRIHTLADALTSFYADMSPPISATPKARPSARPSRTPRKLPSRSST